MEKKKIVDIPVGKMSLKTEMRFYENGANTVCYAEMKGENDNSFRPFEAKILQNMLTILIQKDEVLIKNSAVTYNQIPKGLIYFNLKSYDNAIWYVEKCIRTVIVNRYGTIKQGRYDIMIPAMVFHASERDLNVYFAKENEGMDTILYPTPFMNVDYKDNVCLGSQNIMTLYECKSIAEFLIHWEQIFFKSPFTHMNKQMDMYKKSFKPKTFVDAWNMYIKKKEIRLLPIIPHDKTIGDLI
jgi:PRTRC genetic system protein B